MGKDKAGQAALQVPGQIGLFEFLAEAWETIPQAEVAIGGIANTESHPMQDYTVKSTYRDIFLVINMLDDYARVLSQPGRKRDFYTDYMIGQFGRISGELSEQICLDKGRMYKKCRERQEQKNDAGEDAMLLASKSKAEKAAGDICGAEGGSC